MIFRARDSQIGPIVLDAVSSETHTVSVEVTENPTEDGRIDGGTKRTLPRTVSLTGVVTAKDMRAFRSAPFAAGTRHLEAWQRLKALWTSTTTFDVVTDVETYRNCTGIGDLVWQRDPGAEDALIFQGTFREVASGSAVVTPEVDASAELGLSKGTELGRQGTEVVE